MHALVFDLDTIDVHAARDRATDADDVDLHATQAPRDQAGDPLQAVLRECGVVERGERQCEQCEHRQGDREDDPTPHHSLGEKLMSSLGLVPGRESAFATSIPTVTTGKRQRIPTPVEYSMK